MIVYHLFLPRLLFLENGTQECASIVSIKDILSVEAITYSESKLSRGITSIRITRKRKITRYLNLVACPHTGKPSQNHYFLAKPKIKGGRTAGARVGRCGRAAQSLTLFKMQLSDLPTLFKTIPIFETFTTCHTGFVVNGSQRSVVNGRQRQQRTG